MQGGRLCMCVHVCARARVCVCGGRAVVDMMCMRVYVYMYACMYVCVYVCMHVCVCGRRVDMICFQTKH